ncbi:hypothetical protein CFIMG_005457RA [Ceratocystis fimbriata CBS 114723]|uniref:AA1-like domain-containing protein n=1 Tax=Ceratocystis fimbriata CBS 114723 TaxID=1035309 RepID=A0A2C5X273_9PEZI|nr:hypothetical protein CFIMG_005457RA [Ceratocystis fimbriata CBS 114723]
MLPKVFFFVPAILASAVPRQDSCASDRMPTKFVIDNLSGTSNDTGSSFIDLTFTYTPYSSSGVLSPPVTCSYDASTQPVKIPGRSNRWACEDPLVQFLYSSGRLTMVQKTCIQNGSPTIEASGSVNPTLGCTRSFPTHRCFNTQVNGTFVSLAPAPPSS